MTNALSIQTLIDTILPIILCLAFGKAMTHMEVFRSVDWPSLEKVMFWVFLPFLIFRSIALGKFDIVDSLELATVFVLAQAAMAAVAVLHARLAGLSPESMTSLFQNAVRWNNIIPIALVATLYGDEGMSLIAVALAVMVPLANVSCIFVMEYALGREASSWSKKLLAVAKNPLIVACAAGLAVRLIGLPIPVSVMNALDILGSATLGVGLLVVGASISLGAIGRDILHVVPAVAMKIVGMPLITLALCLAFGIEGLAVAVAVLCTATPTAMQGYIVARNMGGDAELMSSIIAVGHVSAVVTIPLMLMLATAV